MPHSEIFGSKPARGSPKLIAACHVLHRLSVPRHPPDALQALDPRRIRFHVRVSRTQGQNLSPIRTRQELSLSVQTQPFPSRKTAGARTALGHVTCLFTCQTTRPAFRASLFGTRQRQARRSCVSCFSVSYQSSEARRQVCLCLASPTPSPPNRDFRPLTSVVWWRQTGSNRRPPACKAGALPTELCPRLMKRWWVR